MRVTKNALVKSVFSLTHDVTRKRLCGNDEKTTFFDVPHNGECFLPRFRK
jgi:hypothetical protein